MYIYVCVKKSQYVRISQLAARPPFLLPLCPPSFSPSRFFFFPFFITFSFPPLILKWLTQN